VNAALFVLENSRGILKILLELDEPTPVPQFALH
jgi:hypothetical protein